MWTEKLSPEIKSAIHAIVRQCPDMVFGGSIALNAVGLIDRPVGDIDLFCPEYESLTKNKFLQIEMSEITSDTVTNTNGKEIQRTGAIINGVKCCVFKVDKEELQHSVSEVDGVKIKIQNVNYAIMAKRSYASRNLKHAEDLKSVDDTLNELF